MNRSLPLHRIGRVALWIGGGLSVLVLVLWAILLITPIPIPFLRDQAVAAASDALPPNYSIELGDTALALENGLWPVIKISPVKLIDSNSNAQVEMDALDVGFSPLRTLIGQPGLTVTLVRPYIQVIQDLIGPRLAGFELVDDENGGSPTVRILEGATPQPTVRISSEGLNLRGTLPDGSPAFRSDNDWLIYNFNAMEESIGQFEKQARMGRFSRLRVREGRLDMHDSVYGLFRQLTNLNFNMAPTALGDAIQAKFSADLAGRTIEGTMRRERADTGEMMIHADVRNLDFASVVPFMDDPDGVMAVRGAGRLTFDVRFDEETSEVSGGIFEADLSGTNLRVQEDLFPITTEDMRIEWDPAASRFNMENAQMRVGQSTSVMSGTFVMGLDETYGPVIRISTEMESVVIHPNDLDAPEHAFDIMAFSGWSAPLYGAVGIDQMVAKKGDALLRVKGRADMLRSGIGFDMEVGGSGITADDLKRLWPYFISPEGRDWFVEHVTEGQVVDTSMTFKFPLGTISMKDDRQPIPPGAVSINMTGTGVSFVPVDGMEPVAVNGNVRLNVTDNVTTINMDGATLETTSGPVGVKNAAFIIDSEAMDSSVFEISGSVDGDIQALMALIEERSPGALSNADIPIDPQALQGQLDGSIVATIVMTENDEVPAFDYAANGTVTGFGSGEPLNGYTIADGDLNFSLTPAGYRINGDAAVAGIPVSVGLTGKIEDEPDVTISAEVNIDDLSELGFDARSFLGGSVRFAARPLADGTIQISADIENASVNVADLGLSKSVGVPGGLSALVDPGEDAINIEDLTLQFGDVDIRGSMTVDPESGLQSAEFPTFKLSPGDDASLSMEPRDDGIAVALRGEQLDLKPMLKRFFAIDQISTGGPQSTQFDQALEFDVQLNRALGFYQVVAYSLGLNMRLVGEDLRHVSMQAQFAENNGVSIATNPTQGGRTMSVAFSDAGTLLRFLNVYPRLLGGQGGLTLTHNVAQKTDRGQFTIKDFAIADEEKVAEILGNHRDSRSLVERQNRINFNAAEASFIRRPDRIEITEAVLDGDTVGGTARGFVYTQAREYDIAGTYVPLFGLNSAFQKLPLLGPLLGGRDGEGLVGVTFAVRGDLDEPQFLVNPASILLPGAFRSIMEFRSREKPRTE